MERPNRIIDRLKDNSEDLDQFEQYGVMECAIEDPVKFLIQIHIGLMDSYPLLAGMNDRIFGFATTYQTSDVLRCLRQYVKSQMLMIFINFSVYPHEESKEAQPGRSRPLFANRTFYALYVAA
ncbi:MAG: hypothetical protein R3E79_16575 [Caldilineaceae bacterium]